MTFQAPAAVTLCLITACSNIKQREDKNECSGRLVERVVWELFLVLPTDIVSLASCPAHPQSKECCCTKLHFLLNFKETNPPQLLLSMPFTSSLREKRKVGSQGCAAPKPMPVGAECITILPPSSNKSSECLPRAHVELTGLGSAWPISCFSTVTQGEHCHSLQELFSSSRLSKKYTLLAQLALKTSSVRGTRAGAQRSDYSSDCSAFTSTTTFTATKHNIIFPIKKCNIYGFSTQFYF